MKNPEVLIVSIVTAGIIILAGIFCFAAVYNNKIAFSYGYERVMLPGSNTSQWQKVRERG